MVHSQIAEVHQRALELAQDSIDLDRAQEQLEEKWSVLSAGICSGMFQDAAFIAYLLNADVPLFRSRMTESVRITLEIVRRWTEATDTGMTNGGRTVHAHVMRNALLAGDHGLCMEAASLAMEREKYEGSRKAFPYAYSRCLTRAILGCLHEESIEELRRTTPRGPLLCSEQCACLAALQARDATTLTDTVSRLAKAHASGGFDPDEDDEIVNTYVCQWGIALVNLARFEGIRVVVSSPVLPTDLLCEVD